MKKHIGVAITAGLVLSLTACASSAQASCESYFKAVGDHLAKTINGQADLGDYMRQLNSVRDGAPDEMKELLNADLQAIADSPDAVASRTMGFCSQFLGE